MSFNMMFGSAGAGFSWRVTAFASSYFFLEIAGREHSSANSVIISGVGRGVSKCGPHDFQ